MRAQEEESYRDNFRLSREHDYIQNVGRIGTAKWFWWDFKWKWEHAIWQWINVFLFINWQRLDLIGDKIEYFTQVISK